MEYKSVEHLKNFPSSEVANKGYYSSISSQDTNLDSSVEVIAEEGSDEFLNYVNNHGLLDDRGIVVLSSMYHYFYTKEDLQNVKSVIDLKQLNQEKDLKAFIRNIFDILPSRCKFVGRFVDNESDSPKNELSASNVFHTLGTDELIDNGIGSKIPILNRVIDFIDARTNRYLTKRSVNQLLENNGFGVIDITEINGTTYFCSQKVQLYM